MSGITDEAAIEGHDLIHNAEVEEDKLHKHDDRRTAETKRADAPGEAHTGHPEGAHKESTLDKVKEALHLNK
ncbi:hypothetical protein HRG_008320 [Hirsutella rhossiliensis]|uniref:Uncharacterized protein n=1 Tax=Hirsutella rhossiliensis TaxID=111463 RepID=A0A9P8MS25_9HYPO|nr:uncharacterized protein HRG_08320 [Hirsutella rhossiliensis]KAH0960165.1 hypothetical protein HRG_08320 [Hirsutella rhossiliensis]